ncbi:hypothetical protein [Bifidobacterium castoris]|uniref:Leucine rich repeat variant n=1 Tax=Bifidobacterium castoris TaxID=2306972 RepID=A0A430FAK7_9BIFI|nr:hypothetical protein [Bifidobacterium castoris]RSX49863.1 hypothetical protein D2E22_0324 [Bifidobacterium castoris]
MTIPWLERILDHTGTAEALAYDDNAACRWFAARYADRLEPAAVRMLAEDDVPAVRAAMARRTDLDADVLDLIAHDTDPVVLAALATAHDLPGEVRDGMCDRVPDPRVCRACGAQTAADLLDLAEGGLRGVESPKRRRWFQ